MGHASFTNGTKDIAFQSDLSGQWNGMEHRGFCGILARMCVLMMIDLASKRTTIMVEALLSALCMIPICIGLSFECIGCKRSGLYHILSKFTIAN